MPVIDPARLRAAREAAGLRRETVAETVGRSYACITSYERGQASPPGPMLIRLAALYQVPVEALCADPDPAGAR
jgi:transcriptional regulator with XRE-family HTH domain